jgi:hypothetical protein
LNGACSMQAMQQHQLLIVGSKSLVVGKEMVGWLASEGGWQVKVRLASEG